jgi:hypothetical protein
MSSIIRIRRRTSPGSAGAPSSLYQAEIAFNEVDKVLYYGYGNGGGSPATAASIIAIGGEGQYVTLGTNQTITGNKTFSGTLTGTLTGTATSVSNSLTIGGGLSQNGATFNGSSAQTVSLPFIGTSGTYGSSTAIPIITTDNYGRVSGVTTSALQNLTIGAGLSQNGSTYNTSSSQTISLPVVLSNPGSFGSSTAIPVISVDGFGRITSASTTSISTTINLTGNSGTGSVAGGGTLAVAGGTGIISSIAGAGITVAIDTNVVATLTGAQVLTNKQIDTGAGNTVKFGGVQVIGVTGSGTSVVLATSPSLITPNIGAATATSVTASSGNLVLAAASGNNNVNITPTGSGVVDVGGFIIRNVQTPILSSDAVNKSYADAIASSLNVHDSVAAATWSPVSYTYVGGGTSQTITTISSNLVTFSANHGLNTNDQVRSNNTANGFTTGTTYYVLTVPGLNQVTLSTTPGGATKTLTDGTGLSISTTTNQGVGAQLTGTGQTVDQYNVQVNDRILVLNHTNNAYNGVYVVTTVGTGSNGVWTRATDYDNSPTGEILPGDFIFVGSGTTYAKSGWAQTTAGPIIVGTSLIQFTQFSGAGTYTAGTGISIVGNNIALSNTTLTVTAGTGLTGGGAVALGQAITVNNAGVLTVAGTSNQVLVNGTTGTGTSGAITLGLPQAIATGSGVTFGALLVTGNILSSGTGTSLGTIVNTVWNGSTVTVPYGGTGVTTFTTKGVLYGNAGSAIQVTATAGTGDSNTSNQILTVDGNGVPVWSSYIDGGTF